MISFVKTRGRGNAGAHLPRPRFIVTPAAVRHETLTHRQSSYPVLAGDETAMASAIASLFSINGSSPTRH